MTSLNLSPPELKRRANISWEFLILIVVMAVLSTIGYTRVMQRFDSLEQSINGVYGKAEIDRMRAVADKTHERLAREIQYLERKLRIPPNENLDRE